MFTNSPESGIYAIKCLANDKFYIGSAARGFKKRVAQHLHRLNKGNHHCCALQSCWNKYGSDNFKFEILEIVERLGGEELESFKIRILDAEQFWLDLLDNKSRLNHSPIAGSSLGVKHSEEFSIKLSQRNKKLYSDPANRARQSEIMIRIFQDPQIRAKWSEVQKKLWSNPERRLKQSDIISALWSDPDFRAKVAEAHSRVMQSPEYRENMSKIIRERWQDPEYKAKVSKSIAKAYKNPELRAKISKTSKERWQDSEFHEKTSKAVRDAWQDERLKQVVSERSTLLWQDADYRLKITEATKGYWQDQEHRSKRLESMAKTMSTPEYKAKISEASIKTQASKNLPIILIDPTGIIYVTDSQAQFGKKFNINRASISLLVLGKQASHKGWTGYRLKSWTDVPLEAIPILWGEHPDLALPTPNELMSIDNDKDKFTDFGQQLCDSVHQPEIEYVQLSLF